MKRILSTVKRWLCLLLPPPSGLRWKNRQPDGSQGMKRWMEDFWNDAGYAFGGMAKTPAFTLTAVLILALGIGANTAIFGMVNAVLLRPLGYLNEDRLATIWGVPPAQFRQAGMDRLPPGEGLCKLWIQQSRSFEEMATFSIRSYHLIGLEYPERYSAVRISSRLLPMLGIQPVLGRAFDQEDDRDGAAGVAMIGYDLWQRRFGADPGVIGRSLQLNNRPYSIIGVMPPGFDFPRGAEMPVRLGLDRKTELWLGLGQRTETEIYDSNVLALLRSGVSAAAAQGELNAALPPPGSANPGHASIEVATLRDHIVRGVRPALLILLAAVGCVLLMGCANIASLVLARASDRRREMAVRSALGAGRGRIIRLLLTENLLLALLGGAGGLLLYAAATGLLSRLAPGHLPRLDSIPLDWRVLGFSAGVIGHRQDRCQSARIQSAAAPGSPG